MTNNNTLGRRHWSVRISICAVPVLAASLLVANETAQNHLKLGINAMNNGDHKAAIEHFEQAVGVDPDFPNAKLHLANAYVKNSSSTTTNPEDRERLVKAAEEIYQDLLIRDPGHSLAAWNMAVLALKKQDLKGAEQRCSEIIRGDPTSADAYYAMGVIQFVKAHQGRMEARRAAGIGPADPAPIATQTVRDDFRQTYASVADEGLAMFDNSLAIDPNREDAMAYKNLLYRVKADMAETKVAAGELLSKADALIQQMLQLKAIRMGQSEERSAAAVAKLDPALAPPPLRAPGAPPLPPRPPN